MIQLEPLSIAQRRIAWARHSGAPAPAMIASQRLTPAEIAICARTASDGPEAVRAALRHAAPVRSDLLTRCRAPMSGTTWSCPRHRAQLREFETQVRLRWTVYEDWGFGRLPIWATASAPCSAAPSGTGKTMAAQVLARALGLDLYRVDLAGVINKYVGETEKNAARGVRRLRSRPAPAVLRRGRRPVRQPHPGQGRPRPLRQHRDRLPAAADRALRRRRHPRHQPQERPRHRLPPPPALRHRLPAAAPRGPARALARARCADHARRRADPRGDRLPTCWPSA